MNDEEALWIYYELPVNQIKTEIKSRDKKKKGGSKVGRQFQWEKKKKKALGNSLPFLVDWKWIKEHIYEKNPQNPHLFVPFLHTL